MAGSKDYLVEHIGRQWDIVGFDPRGIGSTTSVILMTADAPGSHLFVALKFSASRLNRIRSISIPVPSSSTAIPTHT